MQDNQNKFLTTTFNTLDSRLFMIFEVFEGFSKKNHVFSPLFAADIEGIYLLGHFVLFIYFHKDTMLS